MTEKQKIEKFLERLKFYVKDGLTPNQKKDLIDFVEYKVWQSNREKFDALR